MQAWGPQLAKKWDDQQAYQPGHNQGSDISPGQTISASQLSEALGVHHS